MRRYTRYVLDVAWQQQQKGLIPKGNLAILDEIGNDLAALEPASKGQVILRAEAYRQFNDPVQRRRSRILGVTAGISGGLWFLVLCGAVINIATRSRFSILECRIIRFPSWVGRIVDFVSGTLSHEPTGSHYFDRP